MCESYHNSLKSQNKFNLVCSVLRLYDYILVTYHNFCGNRLLQNVLYGKNMYLVLVYIVYSGNIYV